MTPNTRFFVKSNYTCPTGLLLLLVLLVCSVTHTFASQPVSAEQWQQDLSELVEKIETYHPDPYAHIKRDVFYQQVKLVNQRIPSLSSVEVSIEFMRLVSLLRDRHTSLHPLDPMGFNHWLPMQFYRFSDGFYVVSATKTYKHLLGARLEKVAGTPVVEVYEKTADLHPSDNAFGRDLNTYYMSNLDVLMALGITKDFSVAELTLVGQDGQAISERVNAVEIPFNLHESRSYGEMFGPSDEALFPEYLMAYKQTHVATWLKQSLAEKADLPQYLRTRSGYWYEYLPDSKVMYLAVCYSTHNARNGFESFQDFLNKAFAVLDANPVERVVLDIRFNPGGDGSTTLPLVHEFIKRDHINQKGRLFTLTGRKTYSAAQMIYAEMIKHTNTMLVGEPAGAPVNGYGDPGTYQLTNSGMQLEISTLYWQMGHPGDDSWYQAIDLPFVFSGDDYLQGKDRAMEYLLAIDDRYKTLPEILRSSDAAVFEREYRKRRDLFGQYPWWSAFDEGEMRYAARELFDEGEVSRGTLGFDALVEVYPESWRAWRDYARRVVKTGDTEKAGILIDKGLKINPGSTDLQSLAAQLLEINSADPD